MFNKILVPLDGSPLAERALKPALAIARQADGILTLMRAAFVPKMVLIDLSEEQNLRWSEEATQQAAQEAAEYLAHLQQTIAEPHVKIETMVEAGEAAAAITDCAAQAKADLIVMSSHGYSGVRRWVLGSVAERVLQAAPCPVLVLRGDEPIQHILITLDGSKLAERALLAGLELAARLGAEATLLRVYHSTQSDSIELEWTESGPGEVRPKTIHSGAETYLNDLLSRCPPVGREIQTRVLYGGGVAHEILDYAAEHRTNLIAMSTHGRSGLQQWLYGSVTTKILHAFPGSMLVVRPVATPAAGQTNA